MDCTAFDSLIHAYLDGELIDAERLAAEQHLTDCATCRAAVEHERAELNLMRAKLQAAMPKAPAALKARVQQSLRTEQHGFRRRQVARWSAAAAGIAVCAVAAQQQYKSFQNRLFREDAVNRHARHFPLEVQGPSADTLEAWFDNKLDHRVAVPRFMNVAATGGRLLNVRDHQAAYIRYDAPRPGGARHVGLFVFNDKRRDVDVGGLNEPDVGQSNGFNVVSWRDGDVVYQMVTDLDENDIRAMLEPRGGQVAVPAQVPQGAVVPVSLQH